MQNLRFFSEEEKLQLLNESTFDSFAPLGLLLSNGMFLFNLYDYYVL